MGSSAKPLGTNSAVQTGEITGFVTNGFSLGTDADVNGVGVVYDWVMVADGGEGDLFCGTYTGNGSSPRNITGVGFQGDYIISVATNATGTLHASNLHTTTCWDWGSFSAALTTYFTGWGADGFTVGTDWNVNTAIYHYVILKRRTGVCWTHTYTGNGADNRTITGFGLSPTAFVNTRAQGSASTVTRFGAQTGDASCILNAAETVNVIQALDADGIQVGTNFNANNNTTTYFGLALADRAPSGVTVTPGTLALTLTFFAPTVSVTTNQLVTPGPLALTLTFFAPTVSVVAKPLITYVDPDAFGDAETGIAVVGRNFGATQGLGSVLISPTDDVTNPAAVAQIVTAWGEATNLVTNGGFETNTTGWNNIGSNTIAVSTEQAKYGLQSGKITYGSGSIIVSYTMPTLTVSTVYRFSAWLYIPANWDGVGTVAIRISSYTSATNNDVNFLANMGIRDQWQRVICEFTTAADVTGVLQVVSTGGTPTVGRTMYIDGVQVQTGTLTSPYIETNGATATRTYVIFTSETTGL